MLSLFAAGAAVVSATEYRTISERDLVSKIDGYWVGQLVGNFMGLPFEFVYYDAPMPMEPQKIYNESMADADGLAINRFPDDRCCWPERLAELEGAATDDDTDVEYVTAFALEEHGLGLTDAQLQEYWVSAMNIVSPRTGGQTLWYANMVSRSNMDLGLVPPATGTKEHNTFWWAIDPQLVNEIWSVVYPGMVSKAVDRAEWGARITSRDWGKDPTLFYGAMYSAAFFESDYAKLYDIGMQYVPKDSPFYQALVDVKRLHAEHPGPDDWRLIWTELREKYLQFPASCDPTDSYGCGVSAMINGVMGAMSFLYGEGDFLKTMGVSLAAGYDNDNQAATLGGLLAVMHGAESIPKELTHTVIGFPHVEWDKAFNNVYTNERRPPLPYENFNTDIVDKIFQSTQQAILANGGSVSGPTGNRTFTVLVNFDREPSSLAASSEYYGYAKRNAGAGHGGSPVEAEDAPVSSGGTSDACIEACDANANCDCVTYQLSTRQCWLRSACLAPEFALNDDFWVYAKPVSTTYTEYTGENAYAGNGGSPIGAEDLPVSTKAMSAEHCKTYCEADSRCSCVTYQPHGGDVINGQCWIRTDCEPKEFQANSEYTVYVKEESM